MSKRNPTASYHRSSSDTLSGFLNRVAGRYRNTFILLRFHFSLFLLPVTLFSFYFVQPGFIWQSILIFVIWHLLIFPSSNGYNSYHDRDTGPVGGLAAPPQPDQSLLFACNFMDTLAMLFSLLLGLPFFIMAGAYILASRLYSNRKTRLKKFPLPGFLIVFLFQGFLVFIANITALGENPFALQSMLSALACSFFVGALYPVTQIYQHEADAADGVTSFSMLLGKKMTFLFTAILFVCATICIWFVFNAAGLPENFILFNGVMLPSIIFFIQWGIRSLKNPALINFKNAMTLLALSSFSINLFFIILLFQ